MSARSILRSPVRLVVPVVTLAAAAAGITAQQQTTPILPGRVSALPIEAPVHAGPLQPSGPGFGRILLGTAAGGALGGALGAGVGAAVGRSAGPGDGFISPAEALGVVGLALGYTVGAAVGARTGATVDGARPPLGPIVLASAAAAAAGGVVWNRLGEEFESPESMSSWYMGAAAGVATHWILTSLVTRWLAAGETGAAVPAPGDPGEQ